MEKNDGVGMNILVVDDQQENRILLKEIVGSYGRCDLVANGVEALEMFEAGMVEEEPYDLVLLDIMMPKMDGQELLKKIRQVERDNGVAGQDEAVIIMVTALDSPRNVLDAFSKGMCTDYMVKPITREGILGKMREYDLIG